MSVESFYYCSDLTIAQRYWDSPLGELLHELGEWNPPDDVDHLYLYTPEKVHFAILPEITDTIQRYGSDSSLSQLFRSLQDQASAMVHNSKPGRGRLFRSKRHRRSNQDSLEESYILSFYGLLVNLSRLGPVSEAVSVRHTDALFPDVLEGVMSQEQLETYRADHVTNTLGPCVPEDLRVKNPEHRRLLLQRTELPYRLDPVVWYAAWSRLEDIPGLWEKTAAAGMTEKGIRQLQGIVTIADYAVKHDLAMIKEYR